MLLIILSGHKSGRHIVQILGKRERGEEYSEDDLHHMKTVLGYVKRYVCVLCVNL